MLNEVKASQNISEKNFDRFKADVKNELSKIIL
jgi:hypothetical protein